MVKEVNDNVVDECDLLSYDVMFYDANVGTLEIAQSVVNILTNAPKKKTLPCRKGLFRFIDYAQENLSQS